MEIEAEPSHPKVARAWEPGKCLPQAPTAPRYVVRSERVGEQTQYMKNLVLIGKFMGLWPSKRDLIK
jgi:hypothetical protein